MRSNSSGVRPCCLTSSGVMAGSLMECRASKNSRGLSHRSVLQRLDDAFKNQSAVGAAQKRLTGAFGMRHQAGDVPAFVAYPRDIPQRPVRVRLLCDFAARAAVLPEDLVAGLEFVQCFIVGEVAALAVRDGNPEQLVRRNPAS